LPSAAAFAIAALAFALRAATFAGTPRMILLILAQIYGRNFAAGKGNCR